MAGDPMTRPRPQETWSAVLEVHDLDGTRTRHPFQRPRMSVGRKANNFLTLEADQAVSSDHCEFVEENGVLIIRDLRSANGTFVNEQRISEARLRDGDEVRIGGTRVTVTVRGKVPRRLPRWLNRRTATLAGAALGLLAVAGALYAFRRAAARGDVRLRDRYAASVRALAAEDPCGALDDSLAQLAAIDERVAGRSVALSLDRGEVRISPADQRTDLELLAAWRQKVELYARGQRALVVRQGGQREALEKITRLGQRLGSGKDRKVAFWAEGMLAERLARSDELVQGISELIAETTRFVALVEKVTVQREAPSAAQLAHFRFKRDLPSLVRGCTEEARRTASGALSALNALEE